jgi:hypothetical protein
MMQYQRYAEFACSSSLELIQGSRLSKKLSCNALASALAQVKSQNAGYTV